MFFPLAMATKIVSLEHCKVNLSGFDVIGSKACKIVGGATGHVGLLKLSPMETRKNINYVKKKENIVGYTT